MAFKFCDSMIHDYWQQGYVVFKGILPPSLLNDLYPEADKARKLAREIHGPQAQRLQPIVRYGEQIKWQPFEDYIQLASLHDAINRLLGGSVQVQGGTFRHATKDVLGLLVEPSRPRHHGWHRDWVSNYKLEEQHTPVRMAEYHLKWHKPTSGNQVNCAIYADSCLWYVPGSHLRIQDLPGEKQAFDYHGGKDVTDTMTDASFAEIERVGLEACQNFPRAVRLHLNPGDFCVYRSNAWHTGLYSPTHPRATIHDAVGYDWPKDQAAADALYKVTLAERATMEKVKERTAALAGKAE